ncbi:hypothetical protein [Streptomyces cyslabdanicus]|uniref:hypothetical protein n=1 Tax=Streptomyces cyslabdanicus TaxID=1470456 RepID=UPI004044B12D
MDLEDVGCRARFMIRDRDGKFPELFDAILKDAGVEVVLSGVQMPRMNSTMERWVQTCRRELLDRTLIWSQRYLCRALWEFERFYDSHGPHQGIANARPLHPLPRAINEPERITRFDIRRRERLGGIPTSTDTQRDLGDEVSGKGRVPGGYQGRTRCCVRWGEDVRSFRRHQRRATERRPDENARMYGNEEAWAAWHRCCLCDGPDGVHRGGRDGERN